MENSAMNLNLKKENTYLIKGLIIISVIIFGSYIIRLNTLMQSIQPNINGPIDFIRFFNGVIALLGVVSCYITYSSNKKQELFIISLVYTVFYIDIAIADYNNIQVLSESTKPYLAIGTSTLRVAIASLAVAKGSKLKSLIMNHTKTSIIVVIILTITMIGIEYNTQTQLNNYAIHISLTFNLLLSIAYGTISIRLFIKSIKQNEYIYAVSGCSLFMFATKYIYNLSGTLVSNSEIKLTSVSITYIGFIIFIMGLFIELTQNIKKNRVLEDKVDLFYNAVEKNEHSSIVICDESYNILYTNQKFRNYIATHYSECSVFNEIKNRFKLEALNMDKETKDIIEINIKLNGYWNDVLEKDNKMIETSIQKLEKDNNSYMVITLKDITEEYEMESEIRAYENMKQEEQIKNEFFANVSHELKTPLNIIYSTLQLLMISVDRPNFKDTYSKYQNTMKVNCLRMLRLIDNIVDITKLEVGFKVPNIDNYDIVKLVEGISLSVINYAQMKGINIIFDTDIEELEIKCDPDMIERVMLNLLSNAIKFTNNGGNVYIDISHDDNDIHISVKDEGIGIPLDLQPIIFDRFVQGDKSLRRRNEGSGIGLSIVKSIVEANGGNIYLYSDGINGTEFKVVLPNDKLEVDITPAMYKNYNFDIQKIELEFSDIYELYEL